MESRVSSGLSVNHRTADMSGGSRALPLRYNHSWVRVYFTRMSIRDRRLAVGFNNTHRKTLILQSLGKIISDICVAIFIFVYSKKYKSITYFTSIVSIGGFGYQNPLFILVSMLKNKANADTVVLWIYFDIVFQLFWYYLDWIDRVVAAAYCSDMTISQQDVRSIMSDFKLTRCARRHVRLLSHVAITVGSDQPNVNVVAGAGRYRHWYWMRGEAIRYTYIGARSINRYENAGIVNASNLL